jgi:hypothetical protein
MVRATDWRWAVLAGLAVVVACGDDAAGCPEGSEACSCFGNDTCLDGLACEEGVCVAAEQGDAAGMDPDASAPRDAGRRDGGVRDGGHDPRQDGGLDPDGGVDAGPDAAEPEDAGADGGHHDAGPPICEDTCDEHATCMYTDAGAECVCDAGFEGPGILCTDVDECAAGTDDCDANATCHNTQGGFTCTCNEYYFGPGRACAPIDPATFVRDVSDAPIEWDVSGIGTFRAHGMSRLMWDIEVIATPSAPPRVLKDAGRIRVPDVTLRGLEPVSSTTLDNLAAWVEDDNPRAALVTLRGLRGELLIATVYEVLPVAADTRQRDGKLAAITLSVGSMEVDLAENYFPPQSASPPAPATFIEIDGVTADAAFLPDDIDKLAHRQHGSIRLRKIPNHYDRRQARELILWMRSTIHTLNQRPPFIQRRSMSQVERSGPEPRDEVSRVNCYETWPHQLYLFNPAKRYPNVYLVDVAITTEFCEDA